jgi:hypothetical protein
MIHKVAQKTETISSNNHKLVSKVFQRGLKTIETKSAYIDNKLYYRDWTISSYKNKKVIRQTYIAGQPVKESKFIIDYKA